MSIRWAGLLLASLLFLGGCATKPQDPMALPADYATTAKTGRIGIVVSEVPAPDTFFPGAGCLLCMATASVANSSLTKHTRTLNADELKPLKGDLGKLLTAQGMDVVLIDAPLRIDALPSRSNAGPNQARKDFSALREQHKIDRLLVVHITALGFVRPYSAYIATGDARATLEGSSYIVKLADHSLEWYEPLNMTRAAEGKWDEEPTFPGLSNAYFQVIELSMDAVKKPFLKK